MFMKGYDVSGVEQLRYHLHMAPAGHPLWNRLLFRDYLRQYLEAIRRYEKLKYRLAELYRNNREVHTEGKAGFVKKITDKAKNPRSISLKPR